MSVRVGSLWLGNSVRLDDDDDDALLLLILGPIRLILSETIYNGAKWAVGNAAEQKEYKERDVNVIKWFYFNPHKDEHATQKSLSQ